MIGQGDCNHLGNARIQRVQGGSVGRKRQRDRLRGCFQAAKGLTVCTEIYGARIPADSGGNVLALRIGRHGGQQPSQRRSRDARTGGRGIRKPRQSLQPVSSFGIENRARSIAGPDNCLRLRLHARQRAYRLLRGPQASDQDALASLKSNGIVLARRDRSEIQTIPQDRSKGRCAGKTNHRAQASGRRVKSVSLYRPVQRWLLRGQTSGRNKSNYQQC